MISRIKQIIKQFINNPVLTYRIIFEKIIKNFDEKFVINSSRNPYLKHCNKFWKRSKLFDGPIILCDISNNSEFIISNNYFLQLISEKCGGQIFSFSKKKYYNLSNIRKAQNFSGHIQTKLKDQNLINKKNSIIIKAKKSINSKQALYDYKINDIWIGIKSQ